MARIDVARHHKVERGHLMLRLVAAVEFVFVQTPTLEFLVSQIGSMST